MNLELLIVSLCVLSAACFLGRTLLLHVRNLLRLAHSKNGYCSACSGCAKGTVSAIRKLQKQP